MPIAAAFPVGSVVVADEQTEGIGRHGHEWDSQKGAGLYASVVLEPHPVLTLALGLAGATSIEKVTSLRPDIRWPNDLMFGDKKVGGILVQVQDGKAVAGVGINILQRRFPGEVAQIATSLAIETDLEFRRDDLLEALLEQIASVTGLSASDVIAQWERASTYAQGKAVRVDAGDRVIEGVTAGLDPSGFLRVRTDSGALETILAGGVRPR
jgi:BirA family biotin operon repressor/biotin-[acetyl-CoA-carboxylase] ligase